MGEKENILLRVYDFNLQLIPAVNQFPRAYKYTLGDRIQQKSFDIQESLISAYYGPRAARREILTKTNIETEQLRFFLRLAFELKVLSPGGYESLTAKLNEIGKMCGGWIRTL